MRGRGQRLPRLLPMAPHLFAGLRVRDFRAALLWYEQLLGEPSFFANATEAVWTLAENRSIYVVEHAEGAAELAEVVDQLEQLVFAVPLAARERDQLVGFGEHDALGDRAAGNADTAAALELEQPFVA